MAEFVMKDMVQKAGVAEQFEIASAATSTEEIGNPVHRGTREKLRQVGISTAGKTAVQLKKSDYLKYDYLIVGAGLYGAVFAHEMTRQGKRCLVILPFSSYSRCEVLPRLSTVAVRFPALSYTYVFRMV